MEVHLLPIILYTDGPIAFLNWGENTSGSVQTEAM